MTHRGCYGLIQVMAPNLVSKCLLISNAQNTSRFSFSSQAAGFCSIPHSHKSWLQQLRSNIHIIPLASKGNKASKIIFMVLNSQQRDTDRFQLKFQNEAEFPDSYIFLKEMASEWNRETQPELPRERKREFAALHSHCQLAGLSANALSYSAHVELSSNYLC